MEPIKTSKRKLGAEFAAMFLLLVAVFSLLLHGVFLPHQTLFSNDGPLGQLMSECHQLPGRFTGCWSDLNNIGFNIGAAAPGITLGLQFLLKPVFFSKLYALIALVIIGLGAWCFFVSLRLAPLACILGGLAAALNSAFFSVACWGVAAQTITAGMIFFALAALVDETSRMRWLRVILAGLAVGMGVIEGADVGAIFSLYVAIFVLFQAWIGGGSRVKRIGTGLGRVSLVAICAAFMAAPAVFSLVNTQIKGVVGTGQDAQTKEQHWDWATQWSLPVRETTGLVVPGLFGYRMDTPDGGCYWGQVGLDPAVERYMKNGGQDSPPHGFIRYSGGGFYAGVLVVVLAFWAVTESLRRRASIYHPSQRQWLWFWLVVAVVSLLLSFGRFAPFYQLVYALPYFSTIRNPVKFITLVSFALIVIFAYGVDGLWRKYMQPAGSGVSPRWPGFKAWWFKAGKFETSWIRGFGLVLVLSLLAWLIYVSNRQTLVDYLLTVQFDDAAAEQIASFSIFQPGWFVLFFVLSAGLLAGIFSGAFTGTRARWGGILLGLLLVADLGRANLPWVVYWNYPEKYASNPILDRLRDQPYEHRVAIMPGEWPQNLSALSDVYHLGWLQQQFPYYNIQSFDVVDMPRLPEDLEAYMKAQTAPELRSFIRLWQLTNSRYVLGFTGGLDELNQAVDRPDQKFRIVERFDIEPKPGFTNTDNVEQMTAVPDDNGPYALFEFPGALPRAKLYSRWQINPNDQAVLDQLASPTFDPTETVLVAGGLPDAPTAAVEKRGAGTVEFASYAPKDIVLKSDAPTATVLLLNDHFDPNWKVRVDGRPEALLRCNFIMRGVYLTPGVHTVEFWFKPSFRLLYVSLSAIILGIAIFAVVIIFNCSHRKETPARSQNS